MTKTHPEVESIRASLRCKDKACSCHRSGRVHCPAHDDKHPSLSVDEGNERSVVVHCHSNCEQVDVLAKLELDGLWPPPRPAEPSQPTGCTLAEYADAKQLPIEELRSHGLAEEVPGGKIAIRIPYFDEDGRNVGVRYRTSLNGKDKFRWTKGDTPTLYGRERLEEAREAGYVVLVEGESDCHTLWHYGIPAIGIPGANMWRTRSTPTCSMKSRRSTSCTSRTAAATPC